MVSIVNSGGEQSLSSVVSANTVPFCDKSYKGARVCGMFLAEGVNGLSFLVASTVCRIFSETLADTYLSRARTAFKRGFTQSLTYFTFGDALIDFSYNGCVPPPPSDTELNALRAHYGTDVIDRWLHIRTEKIPLKDEKLTRIEEGICLGASLDFIKQYFEKTRLEMPPLEAIRRNSSRYVMEAPKEAQITQIFRSALDLTPLLEKERNQINLFLEKRAREELEWRTMQGDQALQECHTISDDAFLERVAALQAQLDERTRIFRNEVISNQISSAVRIRQQYHTIIGNQLGLQIDDARIYTLEEMLPGYDPEFRQFLEELPEGCYLGGFYSENKTHAISLVKTNGKYFLYEPNFGTLVFEKNAIAKQLWNLWRSLYFENEVSTLSFSLCSPHEDELPHSQVL